MGKVTAANILYNNGKCRHIQDLRQLNFFEDTYRIELEYDYGPDLLPAPLPSHDGMWRYNALLPLQYEEIYYPLSIGNTPLISLHNLRMRTGIPALWMKDETRSPTGSNKDRATALILEYALHNHIETVSCASTGNVAVSLSIGAAASGIKAMIFVPASISDAKLLIMRMAGATIFKVIEGYEAAVKLSRLAAHTFGWYDRNTGYNPLTLEAKKTVALEIWEQLGRQVPDVIVVPVGDGVTLNGIAKGFRELEWCGITNRRPRLVGVQAAGCQPLKRAWEQDKETSSVHTKTIADGIAVEVPINATMALRDIRESGGTFIAVSDEALFEAVNVLASQGGMLAEPSGAAAFAGVIQGLESGKIERNETVIVLVTGTGLKTPQYLCPSPSQPIHQIHADLDEVKQAIEQ